jgi:uncharacterized protein
MPDPQPLKARIEEDMKSAMRAGDRRRLGAVRLIVAAVKQREIDERVTLDDAQVLSVLDKMAKQRRESVAQYEAAGRQDLVDQERFELEVIQAYLPEALSEAELAALIEGAIAEAGASTVRDMGKVMGLLKPRVQGRADLGQVSARVRERLGAGG